MTVALTLPLRPNAAPAGICWDHRLVPLRWSGALKERQPMCLLPRWRLSPAILPIVSGASRTVQGGDDVGGGVVGKLFRECHGRTVAYENKSAMPKIDLAKNRQCRHGEHMTTSEQYDIHPIECAVIDLEDRSGSKWEAWTAAEMKHLKKVCFAKSAPAIGPDLYRAVVAENNGWSYKAGAADINQVEQFAREWEQFKNENHSTLAN